jgi:inward rectifier potassium channel
MIAPASTPPKPTFDPGLTQQYTGAITRAINADGQFNVKRAGITWRDSHPYLFLISIRWPAFFALVTASFIVVNTLFAIAYIVFGHGEVRGSEAPDATEHFLNIFFFSAHTLTTVGYGNMYPHGIAANLIATFESLVGLLAFAIATGLVFGRFSRPSARIAFSQSMLVSPYQNGASLQFRIVNRRSNNIIDLNARVVLMTVEMLDGKLQRRFRSLELERSDVLFFPLTWTIVHPINESSPLFGVTQETMQILQAELIVTLQGFDETFGQTVHAHFSYRYNELVWGVRFRPAFEIDAQGDIRLDTAMLSETEPAALP